jgi:hypothetical protein
VPSASDGLTEFPHIPDWYEFQRADVERQAEYDYRGKDECVVLSTKDCCYYLYPADSNFNVTKIQFAAERFYEIKIGRTIRPS